MNETSKSTGDIDLAYLRQWTQHDPVTLTETLDLRPAQSLAAMLDQSRTLQMGDILPPLWHWVYFIPCPRASEIGVDGHPKRGNFLPPVTLPRRMWAASEVRFNAPLLLGETVQKQSRITSVQLKQGATGPLVFVTVNHRYSVDNRQRINEDQTLVYVDKNPAGRPARKGNQQIKPSGWFRRIEPDPVMLFRYSALSGNTHRIHFDRDYAVREEAYPGLLVQAPWTAILLAELLREHCPETAISRYGFRALRPLIDTAAFTIHGHRRGGEVNLQALDADGQLAVDATAVLTSN